MTRQAHFPGLPNPTDRVSFESTRVSGLSRLNKFVGRADSHYTRFRNFDFGAQRRENVSALSPWIRHRLISEEEVLHATLARHSPMAAEKFVQEVFWRTYFKGWLEHHPSVWQAYQVGLRETLAEIESNEGLAARYDYAVTGRTGIDCFDEWAGELVETGYLHNHTRMWFASIWIFTLQLPWEMGADFFLQHLMDGDPASNTLSWRWVGGLHTKGKTYLARPSNIAKYTEGRFNPVNQLATEARPLLEARLHLRRSLPKSDPLPDNEFMLLITEEDCSVETWLHRTPACIVGLGAPQERARCRIGLPAQSFAYGAVQDALARVNSGSKHLVDALNCAEEIISTAQETGVHSVVTPYAATGPVASFLEKLGPTLMAAGIELRQVRRAYDDLVWPHAITGFYGLRKKLPEVLRELKIPG